MRAYSPVSLPSSSLPSDLTLPLPCSHHYHRHPPYMADSTESASALPYCLAVSSPNPTQPTQHMPHPTLLYPPRHPHYHLTSSYPSRAPTTTFFSSFEAFGLHLSFVFAFNPHTNLHTLPDLQPTPACSTSQPTSRPTPLRFCAGLLQCRPVTGQL